VKAAERFGLLEAFYLSGLSWYQLWLRYLDLTGVSMLPAMADEVAGLGTPIPREYDLIADALNEHYHFDLGLRRPVGYWRDR
jgi:hypothetical protein